MPCLSHDVVITLLSAVIQIQKLPVHVQVFKTLLLFHGAVALIANFIDDFPQPRGITVNLTDCHLSQIKHTE